MRYFVSSPLPICVPFIEDLREQLGRENYIPRDLDKPEPILSKFTPTAFVTSETVRGIRLVAANGTHTLIASNHTFATRWDVPYGENYGGFEETVLRPQGVLMDAISRLLGSEDLGVTGVNLEYTNIVDMSDQTEVSSYLNGSHWPTIGNAKGSTIVMRWQDNGMEQRLEVMNSETADHFNLTNVGGSVVQGDLPSTVSAVHEKLRENFLVQITDFAKTEWQYDNS